MENFCLSPPPLCLCVPGQLALSPQRGSVWCFLLGSCVRVCLWQPSLWPNMRRNLRQESKNPTFFCLFFPLFWDEEKLVLLLTAAREQHITAPTATLFWNPLHSREEDFYYFIFSPKTCANVPSVSAVPRDYGFKTHTNQKHSKKTTTEWDFLTILISVALYI